MFSLWGGPYPWKEPTYYKGYPEHKDSGPHRWVIRICGGPLKLIYVYYGIRENDIHDQYTHYCISIVTVCIS